MLDPWFKRTHPFRHIKKWFYWPWGAHPALRDAAAVCFTSERERILARQSFWLYKANEAVVGMGVTDPPPANPLQTEAFYQRAPEAQGKRLVLFLSRLHSKKGCDLLLRAFASVLANDPSWRLVMAGPGSDDYVVKLKNIARQLGIANSVSWPGMLEGDAKWGAFRVADVFCLPSHQENFGLAAAEAMACGCPVLVSDQVNIVSEIIASAAGMAAPDTLEGTQQLLTRWHCVSADERRIYARNALRCQREKFDARTTVENIRQLVQKIRSQQ